MAQTATSGAYYVACAADQIYAHRMSITGSIGIIMEIEDYSELMGKLGIKSHLVVSGPNKAVGGTQPVTGEQLALYQQIADESYEIFLDVVSQGRNKPVEEIRPLADGRDSECQTGAERGFNRQNRGLSGHPRRHVGHGRAVYVRVYRLYPGQRQLLWRRAAGSAQMAVGRVQRGR